MDFSSHPSCPENPTKQTSLDAVIVQLEPEFMGVRKGESGIEREREREREGKREREREREREGECVSVFFGRPQQHHQRGIGVGELSHCVSV